MTLLITNEALMMMMITIGAHHSGVCVSVCLSVCLPEHMYMNLPALLLWLPGFIGVTYVRGEIFTLISTSSSLKS